MSIQLVFGCTLSRVNEPVCMRVQTRRKLKLVCDRELILSFKVERPENVFSVVDSSVNVVKENGIDDNFSNFLI